MARIRQIWRKSLDSSPRIAIQFPRDKPVLCPASICIIAGLQKMISASGNVVNSISRITLRHSFLSVATSRASLEKLITISRNFQRLSRNEVKILGNWDGNQRFSSYDRVAYQLTVLSDNRDTREPSRFRLLHRANETLALVPSKPVTDVHG